MRAVRPENKRMRSAHILLSLFVSSTAELRRLDVDEPVTKKTNTKKTNTQGEELTLDSDLITLVSSHDPDDVETVKALLEQGASPSAVRAT